MKYWLLLAMLVGHLGHSQPVPGDFFREYVWIPSMVEEGGKFLRVGGKLDYKINENHLNKKFHNDGNILIEAYVELENASKAEILVEKVGSHEDTKNLRISMNGNEFQIFPSAEGIPEPESDYMHHNYPVVPIPIAHLQNGRGNEFLLSVDSTQRWNWPQNLIYGLILRVYYDLPAPEVFMDTPENQVIQVKNTLSISNSDLSIRQVDYIGYYDGINFEGDGIYTQWHYHFFRGRITHHLGSSSVYPYSIEWDSQWIPDQEEPIFLAARVTLNNGLIYFTEATEGLKLQRDYQVELVKPQDQPKNWVTREKEFSCNAYVQGDVDSIDEARLIWTSWSPCYANGIFINGVKVFDREGPCYEYLSHEVVLPEVSILKTGLNTIVTGKEPLHNGQMVHGMEVQWPGMMIWIKYRPQ